MTVLLGIATELALAAPSQGTLDALRTSVFRVECDQKSYASGFAWGGARTIVTAWHAVAGCGSVQVYSKSRSARRAVLVTRVLAANDLALLELPAEAGWTVTPLVVSPDVPTLRAEFSVFGHPVGVPAPRETRVRYDYAAGTIADLAPADVLADLRAGGWLDVHQPVYSFGDGSIAPGHSGAPVVDDAGRVVAIAEGGLERGALEIAWAVPSSVLQRLLSAPTSAPLPPTARALFSAEFEAIAGQGNEEVRCGALAFLPIRRRRFDELAVTADDPVGLQQLRWTLEAGGAVQLQGLSFDVLRDVASGATIVLPAGSKLTPDGAGCWSQYPGGLRIRVATSLANGLMEIQAAGVALERVLEQGAYGAIPDPRFSYPSVQFRPNGMLVNRKTALVSDKDGGQRLIFETIAARAGTLMMVAAEKSDLEQEQACLAMFGPLAPACAVWLHRHPTWSAMVVGTHLGGYSLPDAAAR